MNTDILEEIGLTKSEIKVYLALLKLGSSTKKDIVKESKITPSKLYEITEKLIEKGLVSSVKKNKVLHFTASPPEQVLDFISLKKDKISSQEEEFKKIMPTLKNLKKEDEPDVEVFRGWQGMRTAYQMILRELGKGDINYVFGATAGEDKEYIWRFFNNYHKQRREKGIVLKIIMRDIDKKWALTALGNQKYDKIKFTEYSSPSEVNIWKDNVMIIVLTKFPVVTLIKSKVVADSFRDYFDSMWKIAKT